MLLLEAMKAAGEWRTVLAGGPVPWAKRALGDGDLDDSTLAVLAGGLLLLAGVVADLAPAEAKPMKDKGGGWSLKADELGHDSLGTSRLSWSLQRHSSRRTKAAPPKKTKDLSHGTLHPARDSGGRMSWGMVLGGMYSYFVGFSLRSLSSVLFGSPKGRHEWPRGSHPQFRRRGRKQSSPRGG